MKYLAAYLLAGIGGKTDPSVSDLENILGKHFSNFSNFVLGSVGADFQKENAETIVKLLNGKSIDEVIRSGLSKLASVPSGGAAPAASAPAAGKQRLCFHF